MQQKIDFKVEKDGSVNIKNIAKQVREVRENIQKGVREQKQGMERQWQICAKYFLQKML